MEERAAFSCILIASTRRPIGSSPATGAAMNDGSNFEIVGGSTLRLCAPDIFACFSFGATRGKVKRFIVKLKTLTLFLTNEFQAKIL
jgi:hypothetical protein